MHKPNRLGIRRYIRRYVVAAIATTAVIMGSAVLPAHYASEWLNPSQDALAKSSGGRSRGGSFKRSTSPSRTTSPSNSRTSQPSNNNSSTNRPNSSTSQPSNNSRSTNRPSQPTTTYTRPNQSTYQQSQPGTVIVPAPVYVPPPAYAPSQSSVSSESGSGDAIAGIILIVILLIGLVIVVLVIKSVVGSALGLSSGNSSGASSHLVANSTHGLSKQEKAIWQEIDNDIVTITRVQVALVAIASQVQRELSQLVADADLSTSEGLAQHLQDVVLVLLRTQASWTHVRGSSQTLKNRTDAETLFNEFSMTERSKLSAETLTNVGGKVKRRTAHLNSDEGPASYIVVTLLVGTAHDQPLTTPLQTEESLQAALKTLAAIDPNYLMVFELIWSPQEETDSLTQEELITEYSDLYQIA